MKPRKWLRSALGRRAVATARPAQGLRDDPECVVLPKRDDSAETAPPVRIFLGTEAAQSRAERIFFFSIERHRDPSREYHVYRMTGLRGFDTVGWRTGFTNYRYAIPEFAGFAGRAIYNDVDQIYTDDPANLFDLAMGEQGYLAISPEDTSVMLIDCERMAPYWNRERAATLGKKQLTGQAEEIAALWGELSGHWNARDSEYRHGESSLIHFTTLHTQPWQPTPEQYTYHPNPLRELWLRMEREADEQGYEVFTADQPSTLYAAYAPAALASVTPMEGRAAIDNAAVRCGGAADTATAVLGLANAEDGNGMIPLELGSKAQAATGVVPEATLDRMPVEDIAWLLDAVFAASSDTVAVRVVHSDPSGGRDSVGRGQTAHWWRQLVRRIATRYTDRRWNLTLVTPSGRRREGLASEPAQRPADAQPRVWLLYGERRGDNEQLQRLADTLGWPYETKQLRFTSLARLPAWLRGASRLGLARRHSDRLQSPWPDVILAAGKRSASVALWIRRRSKGHTRLVHIGRPWCNVAAFDLILTTPQYQLPLYDNVHCNTLPLNAPEAAALDNAAGRWRKAWDDLPEPRLGALIGGDAGPYRLDAETAQGLAQRLNADAQQAGGSVIIACGRRCSEPAYQALVEHVAVPHHIYHPAHNAGDNPYLAALALADRFIVTGDSASMLADACATGRPVAVHELQRQPGLRYRLAGLIDRFLTRRTRTASYRGTPKQQNWQGRLHARLVARGWLTSIRDMTLIHSELELRGLITPSGQSETPAPTQALELPDEVAISAQLARERTAERRD
jgi:mitochondrial fission protein ELM1